VSWRHPRLYTKKAVGGLLTVLEKRLNCSLQSDSKVKIKWIRDLNAKTKVIHDYNVGEYLLIDRTFHENNKKGNQKKIKI
jgi:hypothetical protein